MHKQVVAMVPLDPRKIFSSGQKLLALWHILVWFRLLPCGFANRDLREQLAVLTGQMPNTIT